MKVLKKNSPKLGGIFDKKMALTTPDGQRINVSQKDLLGDGKDGRIKMEGKDGGGLNEKNTKKNFSPSTNNKIPTGNLANHIFSKKSGKLADTPQNRALLEAASNNESNFLGIDEYGKSWFAKNLKDGTQLYIYANNGIIKGAGINNPPKNIFTNKKLNNKNENI
ncbi:MAG: hypothetical protein AB8H03_22220 [Saprospiraceae bacterium]